MLCIAIYVISHEIHFILLKYINHQNNLILILNRGIGNIINAMLKLLKFENKNCNILYDLYAVICHFGLSSKGGHFIAYSRNALNDKLYGYNDSSVTLCKEKNYLTGVPYIHFYQEIDV